ncbi:MAG: hypothetical protein FJ088_17200 [Deltaproteobacteria bacterium]|nr:hypothetical protein [Deltaproteobacteria bacterium]
MNALKNGVYSSSPILPWESSKLIKAQDRASVEYFSPQGKLELEEALAISYLLRRERRIAAALVMEEQRAVEQAVMNSGELASIRDEILDTRMRMEMSRLYRDEIMRLLRTRHNYNRDSTIRFLVGELKMYNVLNWRQIQEVESGLSFGKAFEKLPKMLKSTFDELKGVYRNLFEKYVEVESEIKRSLTEGMIPLPLPSGSRHERLMKELISADRMIERRLNRFQQLRSITGRSNSHNEKHAVFPKRKRSST